jgi:L-fucono-1,5-lactonase
MIIDSHVHVWVQHPEKYPWQPIGGYVPENEASVEMLLAVMDTAGVGGAVLVQPTPYGWDNSYLLDAAERYPDRFRCVCLVDPLDENGSDALRRLVDERQIAGIRINWNIQPVEVWLTNAHHHALWKTACELAVPICLQLTPEYLRLAGDMAEEYCGQMVVDHLGRPNTSAHSSDPQFMQLLALAAYKNVYVKLSGLNYYSDGQAPYRDVWPLIEAVCEGFGAQRCMWGSDFPFVQDHWSYDGLLSTIKKDWHLSPEQLDWVLGTTARNLWWQ